MNAPSEEYCRLIDRICEIKQLADPRRKHERCDLVVDGVPFTLLPSTSLDGQVDGVAYFCDFGPLPKECRVLALEYLLETNLHMFGPDNPAFSRNPQTDHAVLAGRLPLDRITAEAAIEAMGGLADFARQWQATHFLSPQEQASGRPARGFAADSLSTR
ncbi:MAG TPA: CesT family type III secretion system chaperone [Albitalea sp.]|uniref:CesT family type III secretion system chaperone n=1 Tax=Piscinibacter sp. TaxID=1903157 RepID=UPI002ED1F38F